MGQSSLCRLSKRVDVSFRRAIEKKGYLSLCSIVESQFYFPRNYGFELRRQAELIEPKEAPPAKHNLGAYNEKLANERECANRPTPEAITLESRINSAQKAWTKAA